jgi:hypothetical protein
MRWSPKPDVSWAVSFFQFLSFFYILLCELIAIKILSVTELDKGINNINDDYVLLHHQHLRTQSTRQARANESHHPTAARCGCPSHFYRGYKKLRLLLGQTKAARTPCRCPMMGYLCAPERPIQPIQLFSLCTNETGTSIRTESTQRLSLTSTIYKGR